jgi:RNA polymerase sigma-70 factor, ECF subfamily
MTPTDDALMSAIAAGDREAFAALYRQRRADVYRFAVHMTGRPSTAEDVTQDVFLAVIRDAARYVTGRSGVVPWLLGIARNHVLRRLARERSSEPLHEDRADRAVTVTSDPAQALHRDREVAALRRALGGLPASYREVVVLCDLQEMSYAEAAAAIGCAIGTVRSRLHRGRALLAGAVRSNSVRGPGQQSAGASGQGGEPPQRPGARGSGTANHRDRTWTIHEAIRARAR